MTTIRQIRAFADAVARHFQPERIVLFGSYARGQATEDSDVDLLVVMPHEGPAPMQAAKIRTELRAGFPMDLLVKSPETIRKRLAMGDAFLREILTSGKTLYEAQHAGVG